jgi:hypothetical protein
MVDRRPERPAAGIAVPRHRIVNQMTMDDDMYPAPRQRLRLRITTPENRASARVLRRRGVPVAMSVNEGSVPPMPGVEPLGPVQKKVRNLNEKASEKVRTPLRSFMQGLTDLRFLTFS